MIGCKFIETRSHDVAPKLKAQSEHKLNKHIQNPGPFLYYWMYIFSIHWSWVQRSKSAITEKLRKQTVFLPQRKRLIHNYGCKITKSECSTIHLKIDYNTRSLPKKHGLWEFFSKRQLINQGVDLNHHKDP